MSNISNKINEAISAFHIRVSSASGLEAHNDGGIDDVHYSVKYYDLVSDGFIIENDKIVGYSYEGHTVAFDGTAEVEIYSWDNTDTSGWNDEVDRGSFKIVRK